jgi:hypothetical protein
MMMKINKNNKDLHDSEVIVEDIHLKIIVEDCANEKSLESIAQVHHKHIRE